MSVRVTQFGVHNTRSLCQYVLLKKKRRCAVYTSGDVGGLVINTNDSMILLALIAEEQATDVSYEMNNCIILISDSFSSPRLDLSILFRSVTPFYPSLLVTKILL